MGCSRLQNAVLKIEKNIYWRKNDLVDFQESRRVIVPDALGADRAAEQPPPGRDPTSSPSPRKSQ